MHLSWSSPTDLQRQRHAQFVARMALTDWRKCHCGLVHYVRCPAARADVAAGTASAMRQESKP